MFKSGGYNVYPTEIEMVLADHEDVGKAAVVPVQDEMWGEVGVAFVMPPSSEGQIDENDLRGFARDRLANYKIPKRFVVVQDLPALPNGKIDRTTLRRWAATDDPSLRPDP
jgi:acyl-CoA synthetase (AMP-forming)/AMP-acid ligase II